MNSFILFAEDDAMQAELISLACKKAGWPPSSYCICKDGSEAISFLQQSLAAEKLGPRPTRVVTDISMPRIDGMQVIQWMRSNPDFKSVPITVLTTSFDADVQSEAKSRGCSEFIYKPLAFPEFVSLLQKWQVPPTDSATP